MFLCVFLMIILMAQRIIICVNISTSVKIVLDSAFMLKVKLWVSCTVLMALCSRTLTGQASLIWDPVYLIGQEIKDVAEAFNASQRFCSGVAHLITPTLSLGGAIQMIRPGFTKAQSTTHPRGDAGHWNKK